MQQVFFYKLKHVDNSTFVRCYRVVQGTVPCTTSSASIFAQLITDSNRPRLFASSPSKKHKAARSGTRIRPLSPPSHPNNILSHDPIA